MGSRSGTSKKKKTQNQPRFYKKISAQDVLDSTNNDSTESSNQLSVPLTVKTSPVSRHSQTTTNDSTESSHQLSAPLTGKTSPSRHSQTPYNPKKRIRTDDSSEEEQSVDDLLKEIKAIKAEVNQLKDMVNLQGEEIKSLKSQLLNNQISKASKSVIVKGLEPETLNETPNQLKTTFNKVLIDMGIQSNTTVCEIFRIKSKTPPPTAPQMTIHEPVKIAFLTSFERKNFMKNLKNLKAYRNLKISMDCPQMLQPQYKIAEEKAYDLRTQNPGTKTILTIKDQKIIILLKGKDQNNFKEWKEPITDAETTENQQPQPYYSTPPNRTKNMPITARPPNATAHPQDAKITSLLLTNQD